MRATPRNPSQAEDSWRTRFAALLFISSLQYFFVQYIVARKWPRPYSLTRNTISDLGTSICGTFNGRWVCSPWHVIMNFSLVLLGLTMAVGSVLIWRAQSSRDVGAFGYGCLAVGALGVVVVGLVPENKNPLVHGVAATLPFLVGNCGVLFIGLARGRPPVFRTITLIVGGVSLVALFFYARSAFLGLGVGGLERIVAYPQTIWLIVAGFQLWSESSLKPRRSAPRSSSTRSRRHA